MRTITVTLAEKQFEIPVAPIKRAREWRKQLKQPLGDLLGMISTDISVELDKVEDLIALANRFIPILLDAPDTILGLILAYAPALKAQQDFLEENAYDDELVSAFLAILKAAFPLDRLTSLLGPASPATTKSSPAPSGA
ncbi:hypothetical protein K2Z83_13565 [Oscillochloris sp. ZM17-4]|uniref:hypothetical protein n=1 Tax=Oscillochloris sp. ZM17-4 TaxID=2866714 RepID=UPI001C72B0B2|nr:hypothetical protein [Oscillochloris sp. ZM17-4]MBX0328705.1 hypothetical protein [Oscillochloris sp. ZM17-4]